MAISWVFRVTHLALPLLEQVWEHGNQGWVGFKFFFKTLIWFGAGFDFSNNLTRRAPPRIWNYNFTPHLEIFASSYHFRSSSLVLGFSFLSTLWLFLPLNAEIHQIIHPKIHSIISFPPSPLDSSLFISYSQLLAVSSVYATAIFSIGIISLRIYKPVWFFIDLYLFVLFLCLERLVFFLMLICLVWGVSLSVSKEKMRDLEGIFGIVLLIGIIVSAA